MSRRRRGRGAGRRGAALAAYKPGFEERQLVHGDLRYGNVFIQNGRLGRGVLFHLKIQKGNGGWNVKFFDFDWSGKIGEHD